MIARRIEPTFLLLTVLPVGAMGFGLGGPMPVAPEKAPALASPFAQDQASEQAASKSATFICICGQPYCGNNAVSGRFQMVRQAIPVADLPWKFGPERGGDAATGWVCLEEGVYRCECTVDACENDDGVVSKGAVLDDRPAENVVKHLQAWRTGDDATGWQCELKRKAEE